MNARVARGYSLFELILVVVVIGVIAASGLIYYEKALDDARRTGVEIMANRFTAAVALIRGQWIVESTIQLNGKAPNTWRVVVDNIPIFLNEFGWPANTDGGSAKSRDQTVDECYQVWNSILQNPPLATLEGKGSPDDPNNPNKKGKQRYHISVIDKSVCRFELVTDPPGTHAFEYNLRTGRVLVKVPPLD